MIVQHDYDLSSWEAKAGESDLRTACVPYQIQGQPELYITRSYLQQTNTATTKTRPNHVLSTRNPLWI